MSRSNWCILLIISTCLLISGFSKDDKGECIIRGRIHHSSVRWVKLLKYNEDPRFDGTAIQIQDSTFEIKAEIQYPAGCFLFFSEEEESTGGFEVRLILEPGVIEVDAYPGKEFMRNSVKSGNLNDELYRFYANSAKIFRTEIMLIYDTMNQLRKHGVYYSDTMNILMARQKQTKSDEENNKLDSMMILLEKAGNDLSIEGAALLNRRNALLRKENDWRLEYTCNNISLVSYFLIYDLVLAYRYSNEFIDIDKLKACFEIHSKTFPEHPYTKAIRDLLFSYDQIQIGGHYINFSAPDLNGKIFRLSDQITGKIALIDLWASWCKPCIENSRSMIPVYQEFEDKGFTIVGVAGEFRNTENLKIALDREMFPWLTLVELNRQNSIWTKYCCGNSGGKKFLVDSNGTILAIEPDADMVREILVRKLK